jgi:hypothetical protein
MCEIWGVSEDLSLLGCEAVSLGSWFSTNQNFKGRGASTFRALSTR